MAQEQKQPKKSTRRPPPGGGRPRERRRRAQGTPRRRHRRDPRRDRRGAGVQRRGLREVVHPEGRPVTPDPWRPGGARLPAAYLMPGHVLVHRLPGQPGARPAAVAPRAAAGAGRRPGAPRHHHRRGDLPRRGRDGRRPSRHDGQRHRPARHREGLPGRRVLRRRHRRLGRHRGRDGPAVPDRAGTLREDRGDHALHGRQGQPAGRADPLQPRHGHAGPGRGAAVRGLRPRDRWRPDLLLRRDRRPLRGDRLPLGRLRLAVRPRCAEEALSRRPVRERRRDGDRPGAVRRRRRRLRHRRARPDPAHLPGGPRDHRRRWPPAARGRGRRHRRPDDRRPDAAPRRTPGGLS